MFYLMMHSTHFIYGFMESDIIMVKDHSESERGNLLPPHGLLFPISSIPQTTAFVTPVVEQWLQRENKKKMFNDTQYKHTLAFCNVQV